MYRWIFRALPGPVWARIATLAAAAAIALWGLFAWVFPWVEPLFSQPTVP